MADLLASTPGAAFALLPAATSAPVQPALRGQTTKPQSVDVTASLFGAACGVVGVSASIGLLASSATKRQPAVRYSGRSIALKAAQGGFRPEAQLGVQAPVQFWDPLGLASDNNEETFNRRRRVELKHGRVSMLAVIGYIVPEYYRFPGYVPIGKLEVRRCSKWLGSTFQGAGCWLGAILHFLRTLRVLFLEAGEGTWRLWVGVPWCLELVGKHQGP